MKHYTKATFIIASLLIAGCADRNERLEEIDSAYASKCMSYDTNSEFIGTASDYSYDMRRAMSYLDKTDLGRNITQKFIENDTVLCMGFNTKSYVIEHSKRNNAYFVSPDGNPERFIRFIFEREVNAKLEDALSLSNTLKAYDFLQLSRAISAQKALIHIASAYEMSAQKFDSPYWRNFEQTSEYRETALYFKQLIVNGKTVKNAREEGFITHYSDNRNHNDTIALKWYRNYLHPRTEPVLSLCIDMEGNLDPCVSSETVYPEETVASEYISKEIMRNLTAIGFRYSFLSDSGAQRLIDIDITSTDKALYNQVVKDVEQCCGENRRTGHDGSLFGVSGRGFGLSL